MISTTFTRTLSIVTNTQNKHYISGASASFLWWNFTWGTDITNFIV